MFCECRQLPDAREVYWFQNPNSGWPMYLGSDGRVHLEEMEGASPTLEDHRDAQNYTREIRGCATNDEAARILRRDWGAKDIFCG